MAKKKNNKEKDPMRLIRWSSRGMAVLIIGGIIIGPIVSFFNGSSKLPADGIKSGNIGSLSGTYKITLASLDESKKFIAVKEGNHFKDIITGGEYCQDKNHECDNFKVVVDKESHTELLIDLEQKKLINDGNENKVISQLLEHNIKDNGVLKNSAFYNFKDYQKQLYTSEIVSLDGIPRLCLPVKSDICNGTHYYDIITETIFHKKSKSECPEGLNMVDVQNPIPISYLLNPDDYIKISKDGFTSILGDVVSRYNDVVTKKASNGQFILN